MNFGGFLGLAHNHYPIPWSALKYDTALQGYRTGITEGQLKDAPEFSDDSWSDRDWEARTHQHYGAPALATLMAAALIPFLITACSDIPQTEADNWTELCKARLDKSMCQADSECLWVEKDDEPSRCHAAQR